MNSSRVPSRTLAAAAAAVVVLVTVAGCTGGTPTTSATSTHTFSLSYPSTDDSPYAKMAERYMASHPDVTVTLNPVPAENYGDLLRTQLQGGNASDVIMATPGSGSAISLISLADAGLLEPLDETSTSVVDSANTTLFVKDGKTYGQPTDFSVTALVFETTAGVAFPAGYDDLLATCTKVHEDGVSMFALAGAIPVNAGLAALVVAAPHVYAADPEWDSKRIAGKVTFADTKGWRTTLESILEMQKAGCFQEGAEGGGFEAVGGGLARGASLAAFLPAGAASDMAAALGDKKLSVEAFPPAAPDDALVYAGTDYALAISASSANKVAAQEYLDWLAEPAQAQEYAALAGTLPVTGLDGVELAGTAYAPIAPLLEAKRYTTLPVNRWTNANVFPALGSGVQGLLTGQKTVDQVLADLDAAWNS